ncbi:hypothetical protein E3O25_04085 [Cryobacterium sp. TMT1-3]|uniref:hypothetical protein n=1 Tax=Cryobacterium sp. TMT1-3 TaxID=1259237 RepID=UPI00106BA548|nr:hypothetical protein [Cryobacterium sp. TMT1-3]TFC29946.1 hypothetical protein E3O25_04085 [Cryobacterium sp. TMT1-3]
MGATSSTTQRTTMQWTALNLGIVVLGLVLVWLFRFKSTVCAISSFAPCPGPEARLLPAVVSSVVLVLLLCGAVVAANVVPSDRRVAVMSWVALLLAVAGFVGSLVVLFSAGFVVWPVWA